MVDDTTFFDTLTNFRIWTDPAEVLERKLEDENAWLIDEIRANTPASRPGFMGAMAISWYYYPAWMKALQDALPPEYEMVSPGEL